MSDYSHLAREELEARLDAAEDVCVLYGWTGSRGHETDREKALYMAWCVWHGMDSVGDKAVRDSERMNDDRVRALAGARDQIRAMTLASLAGLSRGADR